MSRYQSPGSLAPERLATKRGKSISPAPSATVRPCTNASTMVRSADKGCESLRSTPRSQCLSRHCAYDDVAHSILSGYMLLMHRAGKKIRAWRETHDPPLSAGEFGERYGAPSAWPSRTVYGWEAKGKIPRAAAQRRLAELGICQPEDWLLPPSGAATASDARGQRVHPFYDLHTHGFVRAATSTPQVRTADVSFNRDAIIEEAKRAHAAHVDLLVYPELCVSSYAIDDLLMQSALLEACEAAVTEIVAASAGLSPVLLIGAPLRKDGRLYNCALAIADGVLLGAVPKSYLPNYREFFEKRWFASGIDIAGQSIRVGEAEVPFGVDLIFASNQLPGFKLTIEICEDFWAPNP